jgi:septation ring formation regulator EzrA
MFDPNYNPYEELEEVKRQCLITARTVSQVTQNLKQQATLGQQMLGHLNQMTEAVNNLSLQLEDLHNRIRLIEVARQYDNQYKNTN